jgi:hypothetical protein
MKVDVLAPAISIWGYFPNCPVDLVGRRFSTHSDDMTLALGGVRSFGVSTGMI